MTEHNKADQARKGLIDSVKGKAKEIAGAVTGNDSLTAEGQLEQTQARERKEANSVEAVADAEAAQAHADATEAKLAGAEERAAVSAKTAAVENSVRTEQAAHHRAAEQAGQRDAARAKAQSERDASAQCSGRKPRSATKSTPLPRKSATPLTNIRPRCGRQPVPAGKPTASDGRPRV